MDGEQRTNKVPTSDVLDYMEKHGHCPTCWIKRSPRWFGLSKNHVRILQKVYGAIGRKGANDIHVDNDTEGTEFEMPYKQRSNITWLRYHALVAKVKGPDGRHQRGHWLITARGAAFLKGEIAIPKEVRVFDNRVTDHSQEMVTFKDIMGQPSDVQNLDFIRTDHVTESDITKRIKAAEPIKPAEVEQARMFDMPAAPAKRNYNH